MQDYKLTELQFEQTVIDYLTRIGGVKQWEYRPEIKTTEALWQNFKNIIERNNRNKLENGKLSENEFNQVKREISNLDTPYKAGKFLYGMNGVSEIHIYLDNGRDTHLTIFEPSKTGGGNTTYQVVNQITREKKVSGKPNRRFDVTLLINGLPIIQIELKKATNSTQESLNQMHQYIIEKQYSDIFSTVQILVAMSPNDIRYMANTTKDRFNKDFAFQWQDEKSAKPIRDWKEFSDLFLSIPMAHDMSTNYMILDGTKTKESIKVMRPYQVYATKRIIEAVRKHDFTTAFGKLGYVWHTTGSGKTITSFKTAWLASRLPNVDKVIFLVDRIALTKQTAQAYQAYDPYSDFEGKYGIIADTENIRDLQEKLTKKSDRNIIVTSIQKMSRYVKQKSFKTMKDNILFIVDEAHRSTGDGTENQGMLEDIKKAIPMAAWIGYTGTPRFPETTQIFGSSLHVYTIKEAISDKNVLGFNVQFKETIKAPENPTEDDIDDNIKASVYDTSDEHVKLVVEDILNNWKQRSVNRMYNGLFTVHVGGNKASTPRAMQYYDEFQRQNILRKSEERLKIAVSFSSDTSNSDRMIETNENLSRAITEYNQTFGTAFDLTTIKQYTEDLTSRLNKSIDDEKYLDLVIVIDQLLTGFDAPELNTLYVDRTLKGATLIQAYSRTNRIHNSTHKPWGNVINYRWPKQNEEAMNKAFAIYSNRDKASEQQSMDYKEDNEKDGIIAKPFSEVKKELQSLIQKMEQVSDNFEIVPRSEAEQEVLYENIQEYSRIIGKLKQYTEDENGNAIDAYDNQDDFYEKIDFSFEKELKLNVLKNELRRNIAQNRGVDISEIELELNNVREIIINFDYLSYLISKLSNEVNENKMEEAAKTRKEIEVEVEKSKDDSFKSTVKSLAKDIFNKVKKFIKYPLNLTSSELNEEISNYKISEKQIKIEKFISTWGIQDIVTPDDLFDLFKRHKPKNDDLNKKREIENILKNAKSKYKSQATKEIASLSYVRYIIQFNEAIRKLADEIARG